MDYKCERYLRPDQVAEILGICIRTVRRLCVDNELTAGLIRGSLRISESSVYDYIEQQIADYRRQHGIKKA